MEDLRASRHRLRYSCRRRSHLGGPGGLLALGFRLRSTMRAVRLGWRDRFCTGVDGAMRACYCPYFLESSIGLHSESDIEFSCTHSQSPTGCSTRWVNFLMRSPGRGKRSMSWMRLSGTGFGRIRCLGCVGTPSAWRARGRVTAATDAVLVSPCPSWSFL